MEIKKATANDIDLILEICQRTIRECYSKCYPGMAVEYFLKHHEREKVEKSIKNGQTYLCFAKDKAVGTVSVTENYIHRFFVLPEYQGKGYGKALMEFCETLIFEKHERITLDASLTSFNMYRKRGYIMEDMISYPIEGEQELCYFPMCKMRL